ncbi:thioredoxin-like protein [Russula dissimulans]|nr:thioredoxin-like protein [Russula dissimulans]
MAVVQLTSLAQFNNVINADRVAVIYFWAYWCGPCRGMTPIFNGVADSGSLAGVDFYRVDIDHANDIVQHVGGQTIPGFYVYQRGRKLGELIGAKPAELQVRSETAYPYEKVRYSDNYAHAHQEPVLYRVKSSSVSRLVGKQTWTSVERSIDT